MHQELVGKRILITGASSGIGAHLARLSASASRYRIISQPPQPTIAELRAAPEIVPPELARRYLALPEDIPQRVLDLAAQVVGEAETRYDQARALELFLRTYNYTLELDEPRSDQDIVDYFLFDLQEGYCDYYASSMVVMARAVGIPARLLRTRSRRPDL